MSKTINTNINRKRYYNKISWIYNFLSSSFEGTYRKLGIEFLNLKPDDSILEIGIGTGQSLSEVVPMLNDHGHYTAIDISEKMIALCKNKLSADIPANKVKLICADALTYPYEESQYDNVFMSFALELFTDAEINILLPKLKAALKPDGKIVLVNMAEGTKDNTMMKLYKWFHKHFPKAVDCRPIDQISILLKNGFILDKSQIIHTWGLLVSVSRFVKN